ncbi:hypothetical protein [Pelagicoccus sp. SDUM812003]|uniref:hypothetical protein n=1 Tax=Pelagicoccus sp. SDUM812003 TaxID=3041267 RepID=UPI00281037B0|nr:hypothetical protein [Pelagicoccus sp. SDUM812003]MDQ8202792.1 hypothetical protein [Pelagicoccus sp. SDUM812003]
MQLLVQNCNLVIAGGWNPHIVLQPNWLREFLFPDVEDFEIESFGIGPIINPTVKAGNYVISSNGSRLTIGNRKDHVNWEDGLQDVATKVANFLPHTPVSAVGFNYDVEFTKEEVGDLKYESPFGHAVDSPSLEMQFHESFDLGTGQLNVRLIVHESGPNPLLKVNYHYPIKKIAGVKAILDEASVLEQRNKAEELASRILEK